MPSCYAHYRFGNQVLSSLTADIRRPIQRYRAFFDAGLQGPDPFFFYKPGSKTDVGQLGRKYHYQTGREFFPRLCRQLRFKPSEAGTAYLYGMLCHYCLDSICHPFVHELTDEGPIAHNALESEFARYLLTLDGVDEPHGYDRSAHLRLTRKDCDVIASFYPTVTSGQLYQSIHSMKRILWLLSGRSRLYHFTAEKVLAAMGGGKTGLLMHTQPDPQCCHFNEQMLALYNTAVAQFPGYLEQLRSHMTFNAPLGEEFAAIFG